jgi:CubicO group peptidase (beta-lactamase class C family)
LSRLRHSRLSFPIDGTVDPRFEAVYQAFSDNFTKRGEVGASLCLVVAGKVVLDLWGGWQDEAHQRPYRHDTLVNVFSVGKAVAALAVARLVGAGLLDYDEPVARTWPEFAQAGKTAITVRQLVSHQAGLPANGTTLPAGAIFDWDAMCDALAAHPPWWEPGQGHGNHVNTSRFGLGFQLTQPERPPGPNPGAFEHFGAGGSLGFCDPDAGLALAYAINTMAPRWQNPRNQALLDASYAALN